MIEKPKNARACKKVHYTHRIPLTRFGHSYGHHQEGALQRIEALKYCRYFLKINVNKCILNHFLFKI